MPNPLAIQTPRLELIAGDAQSARAAVADLTGFSRFLNAHVPADWPPDVLADVQDLFATWLETGHVAPGWLHWYVIRLAG